MLTKRIKLTIYYDCRGITLVGIGVQLLCALSNLPHDAIALRSGADGEDMYSSMAAATLLGALITNIVTKKQAEADLTADNLTLKW